MQRRIIIHYDFIFKITRLKPRTFPANPKTLLRAWQNRSVILGKPSELNRRIPKCLGESGTGYGKVCSSREVSVSSQAGHFFRIYSIKPQVDLNLWSKANLMKNTPKTRAPQDPSSTGTALVVFPFLRPMACTTSLDWYGFDDDGASVHDVIGTRDPYTAKLLSGTDGHTVIRICPGFLRLRVSGEQQSLMSMMCSMSSCARIHSGHPPVFHEGQSVRRVITLSFCCNRFALRISAWRRLFESTSSSPMLSPQGRTYVRKSFVEEWFLPIFLIQPSAPRSMHELISISPKETHRRQSINSSPMGYF